MDLGIAGKRAAVAAASQGSGSPPPPRSPPKACRSRSAAAPGTKIEAAAAGIPGRDPARRRRVHRSRCRASSSAMRATRSAASTSSWPTAGARRPATSRRPTSTLYSQAFELNCLAVVAMCHEAVPAMQAQGWGRVVAITSISVRQPIPTLILSNTARAGVTGFLKTLAREVAADGVTVNSLQPGSHDTERIRSLRGDAGGDGTPGGSATRRTSAGSRPSCARSRRSSSPAPRSTSTAARTRACNRRPRSAYSLDRDGARTAHRHDSQPDLGAAPAVRPVVPLAARRRPGSRGRRAARPCSARPTGSTGGSPATSTRAASWARCSIPSPTACCCSSPRVALLVDGSVPIIVGVLGARPGGARQHRGARARDGRRRAASMCSGRAKQARWR